MNEKILKYLFDVKIAIGEVESYFIITPPSLEEYKRNIILKRATERNLEIIGEAINRILILDPDFPIENARKIVGLRNQIIHSYDNISDENIWSIIKIHLPILKSEVEKLIQEF
jgi:uncharacterized protein with HEPN domain